MLTDPLFWVSLATVGWFLQVVSVGSRACGESPWCGRTAAVLMEGARVVLPLSFVMQPRFALTSAALFGGAAILFIASIFAAPIFLIQPFTCPDRTERLRTNWVYRLVRHPLTLFQVLWPLGYSLLFGSWIGVSLTPLWLFLGIMVTVVEDERMLEEYGDAYRALLESRPRIIPFLRVGIFR